MNGLVAQLLAPGLAGAELFDNGQAVALHPQEEALVAGAGDKRRRDVALGRACARLALQQLGFAPVAIGRAPDGRPLWPDGVVGSITHTQGYAAALVARRDDWAGLGIDAEAVEAVDTPLWKRLFDAREQAVLAALPEARRVRAATLLFCAKEATFKAMGEGAPYFPSLHIEVPDALAGRGDFTANAVTGRFVIAHGLVVTAAARL